jgi:hypothetical protein
MRGADSSTMFIVRGVALQLISQCPKQFSKTSSFFMRTCFPSAYSGLKGNAIRQPLLHYTLLFETRPHCVAQAGLELVLLLPQPPKCWHYRHALARLAFIKYF